MERIVDETRRFMLARQMHGPGIVAVSGGSDSVALLHALQEWGGGSLVVAHVNHQLRGTESDADEAFVIELAAARGVPCRSTRVDMAGLAAGKNLEATARHIRYDWLEAVAIECGASWIATGHTADDQAETVLHRLLRGTGLQGLRGIAPCKVSLRIPIIRPLLNLTRADLLDYLAARHQAFRTDCSNADTRFTRNRIRAELLPMMRTFNPEIVNGLRQLAEQSADAFEVLRESAAALLAESEFPRAGPRIILDTVKLSAARPYLVRESLRLLWLRECWPADRMGFTHWNRLVHVVRGEQRAADFPGGLHARYTGKVVQLLQHK